MPGIQNTMREFKAGSLRSGSGAKVTNPKQAIAIGLKGKKPQPMKRPARPAMPMDDDMMREQRVAEFEDKFGDKAL